MEKKQDIPSVVTTKAKLANTNYKPGYQGEHSNLL